MHDRETVRQLQQAHADHIESIYSGLQRIPGNPRGVETRRIGDTRVFCANEDRMENRAIFTGNETAEELEQVTAFFEARKRTCFVELNPANFFRSEPFSWQAELMPALLALGYRPDAFRCVWQGGRFQPEPGGDGAAPVIGRFSRGEIDRFIAARLQVIPEDGDRRRATEEEIGYGQSGAGWLHYIGYEAGVPVSTSTLFIHQSLGYLKWGFTREECRGRGHQGAHIGRRIGDALARGCTKVFGVTDFDIASARNLQRCGMTLAYNYVLLVRPPAG